MHGVDPIAVIGRERYLADLIAYFLVGVGAITLRGVIMWFSLQGHDATGTGKIAKLKRERSRATQEASTEP